MPPGNRQLGHWRFESAILFILNISRLKEKLTQWREMLRGKLGKCYKVIFYMRESAVCFWS